MVAGKNGGKRSNPSEQGNGRQKRRNFNDSDDTSVDTEYRILCPVAKVGGLIGKGGNVIKSLGRETRSKIAVHDVVPGAEERVVYICSSAKARDVKKGEGGEKEEMQCAAQEALFHVFDKILELEENEEPAETITIRLLVPNTQVGCLLGKGGKIIEQMRKDIGCQIRVMPRDKHLPPYATPEYELVQLSGDLELVRKALYAVSTRLYKTPPRESTQGAPVSQVPPAPLATDYYRMDGLYRHDAPLVAPPVAPASGHLVNYGHFLPPIAGRANSALPHFGGPDHLAAGSLLEEEFTARILCPNEKVGSIIGKGGSVIKRLQEETGSKITVSEPLSGSDERVVNITSTEFLDSRTSPAINAALQVQKRIAEASADRDREITSITTRLLVQSNQIGSLLGKGGQIISEMRKATRAKIQIPSKGQLPKCAIENDGLVEISGEPRSAQLALVEVLQKLRSNLFKDYDTAAGGIHSSFSEAPLYDNVPTLQSYGGRPEIGSPGSIYPLSGLGLTRPLSYAGYGSPPGAALAQRDPRCMQR